jgi:dihydroxy-acid dehydratase
VQSYVLREEKESDDQLLRDGDQITLDVANRRLDVAVDEAELEARRDGWAPKPAKYTRGVLAKYAKVVQSAAHGAVCG